MIVETQLTLDSYIRLIFTLTYRKGFIVFITAMGLLSLISVFFPFGAAGLPGNEPFYPQLLPGLFILVVIPLVTYIGAKKNYYSNARLSERITYEFTEEKIIIRGESFTTEQDWAKLYQVKEIRNWVLLYQSRQIANLISKAAFGDRMVEFRELARRKNNKAKRM